MTNKEVLIYTLALDVPGTLDWRLMAKMLAGSLLRNYFRGTVRVFRNTEQPVFRLLRDGLQELQVETPEIDGLGHEGRVSRENLERARMQAGLWKAKAAEYLETSWDVVMYVDADAVSLRGLEHLLEGDGWDILYLPEGPDAVSAAVWAVRGAIYHRVMGEWRRRMEEEAGPAADARAWTELVRDCRSGTLPWRARKFPVHEILNPLRGPVTWPQCREAALLHATGLPPGERTQFLFAMYMQKYFSDPRGTLLNILEM